MNVTVTKDETVRLAHRCRPPLSNAERIEEERFAQVPVAVQGAYGPTVTKAMSAPRPNKNRTPVTTDGRGM